jgi:hypothetical protein
MMPENYENKADGSGKGGGRAKKELTEVERRSPLRLIKPWRALQQMHFGAQANCCSAGGLSQFCVEVH